MNVQSYSIVHYGADYLSWSLRSVYDQVDKLRVIYTPHPSHGHKSDLQPPESRQEIFNAATIYDPDPHGKIIWREIDAFWQEGAQRDAAVKTCQQAGADIILVVDCDEVWPAETLRAGLEYVIQANSARNWLINFSHLWRSFNYVCKDDAWPVRFIDLRHQSGTAYLPRELGDIYHFGYAVKDHILKYKLSIHGHKNEIRPGWYETKWQAWPPVDDCHPTNGRKTNGEGWWNPAPFDRMKLPEFMRQHPFFDLERIE